MTSVMHKLLLGSFIATIIVNVHAQPACDGNRQSFACSCSDSSDGLSVSCEYRGFQEIPEGIPDDVVSLNLMHNKIEELKTGQLERFGKLKSLVLKHNGLHTIDEKALSGLNDLEVLDLSYNKLTSVPCDEFQWTSNLKTLHMTENLVTSLSGQCFQSLKQIEEIDLSSTSISSVEEIPFDQLENLKLLDLSGNSLETIPAGFCPEKGQTVNLHWNPWLCDCALKPLRDCESLSTEIKCAMPYQIRGWNIGDLENADQWMACGLPKAVSSKVMYIEEGDAVNLACDPEVNPYGDVVWWLVEDETWQARGELTIYVKNDHAGTYVCADSKDKTKWAFQEIRVIPPETSPTPPVIPQWSTAGRASTKGKTTPLKTTPSKHGGSSTSPEEAVQSSTPKSESSSSGGGDTLSGNGANGNIFSSSVPSPTKSAKKSTAAGAETSPKGVLPSTTQGSGDAALAATNNAGENNNAVPLVPGSGSKTTPMTSTSSGGGGVLDGSGSKTTPMTSDSSGGGGGVLDGSGSKTTPMTSTSSGGGGGVLDGSGSKTTPMTSASSGGAGALGGPLSGSGGQTPSSLPPQSGQDGVSEKSRHRGDSLYPGGSTSEKDRTTQKAVSVSGGALLGAGVLPDGSVVRVPLDKDKKPSGGHVTKTGAARRSDLSGLWVIIAVAAIVATYILIGLLCCIVYKCRKRRGNRTKKVPVVMIEESPEKHESIELVEKSPLSTLPDNAKNEHRGTSIRTDSVELSDDGGNPTKWTAPGVPLALPDQNEDTGQILDRHSRDPSDRTSGPPRSDKKLTQETAILDDNSTDSDDDDDDIPENVVNPDKWMNPHQLQAIPDQKTDNRDSIPDSGHSRNGSESFWSNPLTSLDRKKIAEDPFQGMDKDDNSKTPTKPPEKPDLLDLPLFRSPKGSSNEGSPASSPMENPWKRLSALDPITPYDSLTSSPTSSVRNGPTTASKEPPFNSSDSPPPKIQDIVSGHLQRRKPEDEPKEGNFPPSDGNVPRSPPKVPSIPVTNIDKLPATIKDKSTDHLPRLPGQKPSEEEARKGNIPTFPKSSERQQPQPLPRRTPNVPVDNDDKSSLQQKPANPASHKPNNEPPSTKPKENLRPTTTPSSDQATKTRPLSLPLSLSDGLKKLSIFTPEESAPVDAPAEGPPKPPLARKSHKSGYASLSRSRDFIIPPFDN